MTGNCSSEYKIVNKQIVESEITKKRDLSNCTSRSHNITKLNPVTYDVNSVSNNQEWTVFNSVMSIVKKKRRQYKYKDVKLYIDEFITKKIINTAQPLP